MPKSAVVLSIVIAAAAAAAEPEAPLSESRSPRQRLQAARELAQKGKTAEALAHLQAVVGFGVRFDPAEEAWRPLRADERFRRLQSEMRARTAPLIRSDVAWRLDRRLVPENVAYDPHTKSFFVGSMYQAKIIRIAEDGSMTDFVPSRRNGLLSVLGMKVDARRRELWAAAGNFIDSPPMEVRDPGSEGKGALFRFHLETGELIGVYRGRGEPQFNDLVVTPGGDVFTTAGAAGIWRLRAGTAAVEPFFAREGSFFNGIAMTPDGRTLFGASWAEGVIRIDVATGRGQLVDLPPGAILGGIDGLYLHENSLVAIQNGTNPARVVRAWLNPEMTRVVRFAVLEQEHPESDIPLTGVIVGDVLYYVGRSQLRAFDDGKIWPDEKLKDSTILALPIEITIAPAPDLEHEKATLLEMHRGEIRAHVERNADWIAATHGDDFISASRGKIDRATAAEARAFFERYFEGASYPQYEDLEPPVIRVSDDGSMAWVLSRMRVRRVKDGDEASFVYAGIMAYAKRDGRWVRVANASTFE